jgi:hypothetical protein
MTNGGQLVLTTILNYSNIVTNCMSVYLHAAGEPVSVNGEALGKGKACIRRFMVKMGT